MRTTLPSLIFFVALWSATTVVNGDEYTVNVHSVVKEFCVECHNANVKKGELDLTQFKSDSDVSDHFRRWQNIVEFIRNGEMPPEDAGQPTIDQRNAVADSVERILVTEATKHAGDPGIVLPRRLSNSEYDTAIRDLTGIDIRPTRDFPDDPAGGEGFDNTGESLGMSPNLVTKYLAAAQLVADHLVLKPRGIFFAPFPVTSYNERKKLTEQTIIDFYESRNVDTMQYLEAAWRDRYKSTVNHTDSSLSPKYLALVAKTLDEASGQPGFLRELGERWDALPAPSSDSDRPVELRDFHQFIEFYHRLLTPTSLQLIKPGAGNWPISHLDYRERVAASRDKFDRSVLTHEAVFDVDRIKAPRADGATSYSVFLQFESALGSDDSYVIIKKSIASLANRLPNNDDDAANQQVESLRRILRQFNPSLEQALKFGVHPLGDEVDEDAFVVKTPAVVEIPVTAEMQQLLKDKYLVVQCQLDGRHSNNGAVLVRHATGVSNSSIESDRHSAEHSNNPGLPPFVIPSGQTTPRLLIDANSTTAEQLAQSADVFLNAFPNQFFFVDETRGLTAGFHLVEGFFRDDRPLVEKVLSEKENTELDRLWQELDFVTQRTETLLRGFVWFERSEREVLHDQRFSFLRSEDPQLVETGVLAKFEELYLDKMGVKRIGDTIDSESPDPKRDMIHGFFEQIRDGLTRQRESEQIAQENALVDLGRLAQRAFRRPLTGADQNRIRTLFDELRGDGQSIEASVRGVLIAVLMSPDFCYLWNGRHDGDDILPLDDHELASRLSFFLWSSLPDDQLLSAATEGRLIDEKELISQTRRMLGDERVESFAREFVGQWLRFRDYLDKDPINAAAFPEYTDELRQAIFDEPVRLVTHLIQTDGRVTDLISGDTTFVNDALAKHYGGDIESQYHIAAPRPEDGWKIVSGLHASGRGGLFGMAVVLAKNSAGERTSPVKRGFWTVHHLLGQHFPPPPADVPELPKSEMSAEKTIRELLASHVSETNCAMCHSHFDSFGLAMEGFDPIGRLRTVDGAGRPVDNIASFPGGETGVGIPGLIQYIEEHRRDDFVRTMCRKFLGYALGRSVLLSDQPLLDEMKDNLQKNDFRFSVLFETVVRSPQFRNRRNQR
ncbi:MAG: DUF1592 domain-containing protein [Planctomycetales bacterium]|nr:DUF1592 domain-containing protein [Planctomycetales bacterium]